MMKCGHRASSQYTECRDCTRGHDATVSAQLVKNDEEIERLRRHLDNVAYFINRGDLSSAQTYLAQAWPVQGDGGPK